MADRPADKKITEIPGKNEAVVGTAAEYAAYVNFGTRRQGSNPFLSAAGEIIKAKLKGSITADQQLKMRQEIAGSFNRQIKEGVEIIRYGKPEEAIQEATEKTLLEAAINLTSTAKSLTPVDSGYLRNSIMYRVNGQPDGGFNK